MKPVYYRSGTEENLLGNFRYVIQQKKWYGWRTILTFDHKKDRDSVVLRLKENTNNIFI